VNPAVPMKTTLALISGLLFGIGLLAGGMADPGKVLGFLDVTGRWDPSLAFVMGGAIAVGLVGFAIARRRTLAWSGDRIDLPPNRRIDARLLLGGAIFGIGWGIGGFCPGPAITALGAGFLPAVWFTIAMLIGMWAHDRFLGSLFATGVATGPVPRAAAAVSTVPREHA
jgi:uncharacterized membrane protein YedE/YeeE